MAPLWATGIGGVDGMTFVGSATSTRGFIVRQPPRAAHSAAPIPGLHEATDHSCPSRCSIWSVVWMALEFSS